ncbi:MAG: hybrid sensor histidine kinase/response regulator [Desulfobacteraceae bacterium]|nr:MAG: hybrid sensor histidine kinase/response regulator [Desulfobacteraceae bacterium]
MNEIKPESTNNILIVDDEEMIRHILAGTLTKSGYSCYMASNASEARAYLKQKCFEMVLSDLIMPGESGLELIRFIRSEYPETAVIIVSAINDLQTAHAAIEMDLYGYIVKPFDTSQILISVDNALRRRELEIKEKAYHQMLEQKVYDRTMELQQTVRELEVARKEKEDAAHLLHDQLIFMQTLMDSIPAPIFYKDMQGKYKGGNLAFESYSGVPKDQIAGKTVFDIAPAGLAEIYHQADMKLIQEAGRQVYEASVKFADGSLHEVIFHKDVYRDGQGLVAGIVGVMLDITERKRLERKLLQSQKLESIGQMAAGLAHEINTPAQYVGDNMGFLQEALGDLKPVFDFVMKLPEAMKTRNSCAEIADELERLMKVADMEYLIGEIPQSIAQSLDGIGHVSKIVHSMRDFASSGKEQEAETDLNKAIESAITIAQNEWKPVAVVETDFAFDLPTVSCLAGEVKQAFLNVMINAAHAVEEVVRKTDGAKGKITVTTCKKGDFVEIRFIDTGCGIPESIRHRIFDPFFTTKGVGRGIGQGLNVAYRIITENHGGSMDFITEEDKGTTFILMLPIGNPVVRSHDNQ